MTGSKRRVWCAELTHRDLCATQGGGTGETLCKQEMIPMYDEAAIVVCKPQGSPRHAVTDNEYHFPVVNDHESLQLRFPTKFQCVIMKMWDVIIKANRVQFFVWSGRGPPPPILLSNSS